jgi:TorA maturation chaperone TorD
MEIERFMRTCGVGQAEGKNEPLDHIATEFEFLQYLALVNAGVAQAPEGVEIPASAFDTFLSQYVANWLGDFACSVTASTELAFYRAVADMLKGMGTSLGGMLL